MKKLLTLLSLLFVSYLPLLAQSNSNISLLSRIEYDVELSDVWGFTDENGREYALVGLENGTSILDLSIPSAPIELARIPGGLSFWKDIKTYQSRAFVVGEYPQGMQIIDLTDLPNSVDSIPQYWTTINPQVGRIGACHNIYIEEKTGIAYLSGCSSSGLGVIIVDVKPEIPVYLGKTNTSYSHDVFVRNDTIYSSDIDEGVFTVIDGTNKNAPVVIANQNTPSRFTHNTWLSDNGKTLFTTDEVNDAPVTAYDVSDLSDIRLLDRFYPTNTRGTGLIPHNVHVKNDFLITSYYAEGIVITDASRPDNLIQVGSYDTYNGPNNDFFGTWGAFPFFESDIILASDILNGLFILQPKYTRATFFNGLVTDSLTNNPISSVQIEGINRGVRVLEGRTGVNGDFEIGTTQTGNLNITFSNPAYQSKTITVRFESAALINEAIQLVPLDSIDNTTSLTSLNVLPNFEVSPNPFKEYITIDYDLLNSAKHGEFILTDVVGKVVKRIRLEKTNTPISIGKNLASGIYFGQIHVDNKWSNPLKLIRQ